MLAVRKGTRLGNTLQCQSAVACPAWRTYVHDKQRPVGKRQETPSGAPRRTGPPWVWGRFGRFASIAYTQRAFGANRDSLDIGELGAKRLCLPDPYSHQVTTTQSTPTGDVLVDGGGVCGDDWGVFGGRREEVMAVEACMEAFCCSLFGRHGEDRLGPFPRKETCWDHVFRYVPSLLRPQTGLLLVGVSPGTLGSWACRQGSPWVVSCLAGRRWVRCKPALWLSATAVQPVPIRFGDSLLCMCHCPSCGCGYTDGETMIASTCIQWKIVCSEAKPFAI